MKAIIFFCCIFLCLSLLGAEWKKINPNTIEVSGDFNENELQNLSAVWSDEINSIIVQESRSNKFDLSVGHFLKTKKYDLTIKGVCGVGCVENLLLPAEIINIENGCIRTLETARDTLKYKKNDISSIDHKKTTKNEYNQYVKYIKNWKKYQDELFKMKKIKPTFYSDHSIAMKGPIYFPSTLYLKASGLKIKGEVSLDCISKSKSIFYYYK